MKGFVRVAALGIVTGACIAGGAGVAAATDPGTTASKQIKALIASGKPISYDANVVVNWKLAHGKAYYRTCSTEIPIVMRVGGKRRYFQLFYKRGPLSSVVVSELPAKLVSIVHQPYGPNVRATTSSGVVSQDPNSDPSLPQVRITFRQSNGKTYRENDTPGHSSARFSDKGEHGAVPSIPSCHPPAQPLPHS